MIRVQGLGFRVRVSGLGFSVFWVLGSSANPQPHDPAPLGWLLKFLKRDPLSIPIRDQAKYSRSYTPNSEIVSPG